MNILNVKPGQSIVIPSRNVRGRVRSIRRWSVNGVERVDVWLSRTRWVTVSPECHVVVR